MEKKMSKMESEPMQIFLYAIKSPDLVRLELKKEKNSRG
jgi:hypothetical protein